MNISESNHSCSVARRIATERLTRVHVVSVAFDQSSEHYRAISIQQSERQSAHQPTIPVITRLSRRPPILPVQHEAARGPSLCWVERRSSRAPLVRATSQNPSLHTRSLGCAHKPAQVLAGCQSFEVMCLDGPRLSEASSMFARSLRLLISLRSAETADDHGNDRQPVDSRRIELIVPR